MSNLAGGISKQIRAATNWTQQELADRLEISRNYVALIETGDKKPSVRLLNQLEQMLTAVEKGDKAALAEKGVDLVFKGADGRTTVAQLKHARLNADQIRKGIRSRMEALIDAAGDDLTRLGWIYEQHAQHLQIPAGWRASAAPGGFRVDRSAHEEPHSTHTGKPVDPHAPSTRSA